MTISRSSLGLLFLVLAGCGAGSDAGPPAPTSDAPSESTPSEAPSSASPTAADGTDYAACDDGACEVAVSEPVEFAFDGVDGPVTLHITEVGDNRIEFEVGQEGGGTASGSLEGICASTIDATSMSSSCYAASGSTPPPPEPAAGVLVLELLGQTDEGAIVRLTMG